MRDPTSISRHKMFLYARRRYARAEHARCRATCYGFVPDVFFTPCPHDTRLMFDNYTVDMLIYAARVPCASDPLLS